jgi:hypothetical protein
MSAASEDARRKVLAFFLRSTNTKEASILLDAVVAIVRAELDEQYQREIAPVLQQLTRRGLLSTPEVKQALGPDASPDTATEAFAGLAVLWLRENTGGVTPPREVASLAREFQRIDAEARADAANMLNLGPIPSVLGWLREKSEALRERKVQLDRLEYEEELARRNHDRT